MRPMGECGSAFTGTDVMTEVVHIFRVSGGSTPSFGRLLRVVAHVDLLCF